MPYKSPFKSSMMRRCQGHDYSLPSLYMVTMAVKGRHPLFGRLVDGDEPRVELSLLGQAVAYDEISRLPVVYPNLSVRRYIVMPDHVHIIIHVREEFPVRANGKKGSLGFVVSGFKAGCRKSYRAMCPNPQEPLFEDGYNDRLILGDRHYERWRRYVDDNPRRLAIKREHPDYFTVLHDLDICGTNCQITGNRFLLDIPDKMAVVVHRADTDDEHQEHRRQWLACGERGGVLVSAAVAPREKEVMREAMDRGYSIILLRENGFPDIYKPAGEAFEACASGQLLQISPWGHHNDRRLITRDQCLFLNDLAEKITEDTAWY